MEKANWFESWFDTSYYHTLYKNRDDQEAQAFIGNLVDKMQLPQGSHVLDLACGKGRHSVTLFTHGYNVLGVDLSPQSIDYAEYMSNEHLQFQVHDMREVIQGEKFDAVFNLFTSFGYFATHEDNKKVLSSVNQMLNPEGLLLIDFMNASKVISNLVTQEIKEVDGITFNISRKYDGDHIFKYIHFEADGTEHNYMERVQALKLADFQSLLQEANFDIIDTFGDFNLGSFDEANSDRLIILARKR